jgi:hypothetical protein
MNISLQNNGGQVVVSNLVKPATWASLRLREDVRSAPCNHQHHHRSHLASLPLASWSLKDQSWREGEFESDTCSGRHCVFFVEDLVHRLMKKKGAQAKKTCD